MKEAPQLAATPARTAANAVAPPVREVNAPIVAAWTTRERIVRHARAAAEEPAPAESVARQDKPDVPAVEEAVAGAELGLGEELVEPDEAMLAAPTFDAARRRAGQRRAGTPRAVGTRARPSAPHAGAVPAGARRWTTRPGFDAGPSAGLERAPAPTARGPPQTRPAPFIVQTKLEVSVPGDALEREAEAVAAGVLGGPRASARLSRPPARAPPVPQIVADVVAAPAGGHGLDASIRHRIEPHVGIDLGHVRVRQDAAAVEAARALKAHAFTSGSTIFLGASASPRDAGLMAHEAAHVAQQNPRTQVMRFAFTDLLPDWAIDGIRGIPGYRLLTYITGTDPLTDQAVAVSRGELIETLLTFGPFGAAVGTVLQAIDVLTPIFEFVSEGLQRHDLTLARVMRDIGAAWDEMGVTLGIDGNVAIVRRYVSRFLDDVRGFVGEIVDRVIQMVREVVADVAEPLLETPEIAPVWNLTKKVLRYDPLHGREVQATTAEIIADFLRLIGQEQRLQQMQERGTLETTAAWLDTQLGTFLSLIEELGTLFSDAWAAIQPENLPNLLDNLGALAQRAFGFVQRVGAFAATVIVEILRIIKEALLNWLSEHAHTIPGFHLLTVILGRNPFTGEAVPRTAQNLIKGFITLLPNGEETYNQLEQSGVIGEAAGRIEEAMTRLGISWEMVTRLFRSIWDGLSLDDLLNPIGAFIRVLDQFADPLRRLVEFVGVVIGVVIELVLRLMNFPTDLLASIVANARQAIEDIKRDPIAFLKNMLAAVKLGFTNFFNNILTYLLQGLQAWLLRGLGRLGITTPSEVTFQSILPLVLQVLGISAESLWTKLGQHIGAERVAMIRRTIDRLAGAWQFIKDVQEGGIGAVWRYVRDQLSNLWDTLLGMARDWIMRTIVQRVTARLLTLLDPTGVMAVVNGFIAFFNAVHSAIEYLRDILQIVDRYVSTLAAVAAGNIVPGAQMLEQGLAAAIPVAIGFLANQVGLGNIPEQLVVLIERLRALVDQALDWLIAQAIRLGQAALNAIGVGGADTSPEGRKTAALTEIRAAMTQGIRRSALVALLADVRQRLELRRCELVGDADVVVENSAAETVRGVLSFSQAEITGATGVQRRLPGRRGGRDFVVGEFTTTGETHPTIRGLLEPYRADWAAWAAGEPGLRVQLPAAIADQPAEAMRPSAVSATLKGVLDIKVSDVPRTRGRTNVVGDMGDVEHAVRAGNRTSNKVFVGGHVIAHELGGPEEYTNLVPMRTRLNDPIYKAVEQYVVSNIFNINPALGLAPEELGLSAALEFTMSYPGDVKARIWQLADLVSTEIGPGVRMQNLSQVERAAAIARMEEARRTLRASIIQGASGDLTIPSRIPTAITLTATFTAPPSPAAPASVAEPNVTRELDPLIVVPGGAAGAAAPAAGAAPPAAASTTGPWQHVWAFTQST